jgi:hypothetical protein
MLQLEEKQSHFAHPGSPECRPGPFELRGIVGSGSSGRVPVSPPNKVFQQLFFGNAVALIHLLYPASELRANVGKDGLSGFLLMIEESDCLPHYFGSGLIEASFNLLLDQLFEFRGEGDVHRKTS